MGKRRVVVTGVGAVSPFGLGAEAMCAGLAQGKCALSFLEQAIEGVDCSLAGLVPSIPQLKEAIPRLIRRSMSPMSLYAYLAGREALEQAGFSLGELPRMGICLGSTMGSGETMTELFKDYLSGHIDRVKTGGFLKILSHTASSNLMAAFGLTGRLVNPTAACAAGLQSIGLAYEMIAFGREDRMLCGGTEEYTALTSATFDKIGALSHSTVPEEGSRPFDIRRDGIVCSEGAGILILESLASALDRKATILGEIRGFGTRCSPLAMAQPDTSTICLCMRDALEDANCPPSAIRYINAHATGTQAGDRAEAEAIRQAFGDNTPVSSLKAGMGHAMAASGSLETIACLHMLHTGSLIPCRADLEPDPACGSLHFALPGESWEQGPIVKNSFALGGVYASLVLDTFSGSSYDG